MRRPYRMRRIELPPRFVHFKPAGVPRRHLERVALSIDELEAVRLADLDGLEHLEASERMQISRTTFTRLIEKARRKIADALIEGKDLVVEGGNVEFASALYRCRDCGDIKPGPDNEDADLCPECGSTDIENLARCCMGRHGRGFGKHRRRSS